MALFNLTSDGVQLLVHTILSGTVQETFDTKFNLYFDNEDFSITQDGDKSIVGFSGSAGQLIAVANGNNVGYMLAQEDPNNHSAPGNNAIDLSTSDTNALAIGGLGAEGEYSFAIGYESYAKGDNSIVLGEYAYAEGDRSFALFGLARGVDSLALGGPAQAIGNESVAIGAGHASSFGEVAMGNNTELAGNATTWVETDRAFVVGIGTGSTPKDGLSIYKNGKVYADELTVPNILDDKQLVTKEYVTGTDSAGFTLTGSDLEIDLNRLSGINYLDTTNTDNVTNITTSTSTVVNGFAVIRFDTAAWLAANTPATEPTVDTLINQKIGEVEFADYDTVDMLIYCTAATKNVEYMYLPV